MPFLPNAFPAGFLKLDDEQPSFRLDQLVSAHDHTGTLITYGCISAMQEPFLYKVIAVDHHTAQWYAPSQLRAVPPDQARRLFKLYKHPLAI